MPGTLVIVVGVVAMPPWLALSSLLSRRRRCPRRSVVASGSKRPPPGVATGCLASLLSRARSPAFRGGCRALPSLPQQCEAAISTAPGLRGRCVVAPVGTPRLPRSLAWHGLGWETSRENPPSLESFEPGGRVHVLGMATVRAPGWLRTASRLPGWPEVATARAPGGRLRRSGSRGGPG